MSKGDRYVKIVEWSEEDRCFIGSCPELFIGGCHGSDAKVKERWAPHFTRSHEVRRGPPLK